MNINELNLSQLGKAAICYAQLYKWHVFPLVPKNKDPITTSGFYDATIDQSQIVRWWESKPNANVGIRTGKESGVIVIDIDVKNEKIGDVSIEELETQYEPLPETVEAKSGSGGRHIFFKYPEIEHYQLPSRNNWLVDVDIKADFGYIVGPPSIHPNGRKYEFDPLYHPSEIEIAEIPEWLLNKLMIHEQTEIKRKSSSYWKEIISGVNEGGRNNATASLVGYLLKRYVDPSLVVEIVHLWNERNNPPLKSKELDQIINSIAGKELARRRGDTKWTI